MRLALLALVAAGCSPGDATPDLSVADLTAPPPLCTDDTIGTDAAVAPTLANVQTVFDQSCVFCHCCSAYLSLAPGSSRGQLVQRPTSSDDQTVDESCGGVLVVPGDAGVSYLYQKVSNPQPCAGSPMPHPETIFIPLPACEQDLLRRWINAGAPP